MTAFDKLKGELATKPGVTDPAALAATIGRKKLGADKFNAKAAAGRRKKHHKKKVPAARAAMIQQYLKQGPPK